MFIERAREKAQSESLAIIGQISQAYDTVNRQNKGGMAYGVPLTAQNVAVGDYAMTNTFQYGRSAQDERALIHYRGWPYTFIRPLAVTIAGQQVRVAQKTSSRRPSPKRTFKAKQLGQKMPTWLKGTNLENLDIFEDHPILDVFDQPNDIMGKWHLIYVTVACLQLCGRQHWWLTTDKATGRPCIWPIPPSWIQPVHTKDRAFDHWSMMPGGTGQPVPIPRDEIVYFFYPDPGNPLGVVSPLAACSRMVIADDAIWEAQSRSFRQGIWPGMAVIAGEYIDDDGEDGGRPLLEQAQRQQIYQAIRRSWGGVMNMNEPLILDALIKDVKKLTNTPAEMDFMQSGKVTRNAIQQAFGSNDSVSGSTEALNRATAVASRFNFADFSVNPLIQMLSETLTFSIGVALAQEEDQKIFVWIEPYHPDEQGERRLNYQIASQIGAKITQNEARTNLCNLPPLSEDQGGEEFCQAAPKGGEGAPKGAENAAEPGTPNMAGANEQPGAQDADSSIGREADVNDAATDTGPDGKQQTIIQRKSNPEGHNQYTNLVKEASKHGFDPDLEWHGPNDKGEATVFTCRQCGHHISAASLGSMKNHAAKKHPDTKAISGIRQTSVERRDRRKRRQALFLKAHTRHENKLVPILKGLFHEQAISCMEGLVKLGEKHISTARHVVNDIFNADEWTKRLKKAVKPELHKAMLKAGMSEWAFAMTRNAPVSKAADIDDILIDLPPELRAALGDALDEIIDADFWDDVSDTTKQALVDTLKEGIDNNESLYQLCCRIGDDPTTEIGLANPGVFTEDFGYNPVLGNGPSTARAKLIARTETTGCFGAAHSAAIDALVADGIATGKFWSALDDIHTREAHVEADEEYGSDNPIGPDENFILHDDKEGDVEVRYPGDMNLPASQRCNCRCLVQSAFPEDAEATDEDTDEDSDEGSDEGSDEDQGDADEAFGDGNVTTDFQQASLEGLAVNVTEYVMKALSSKEWDESQHPRAADGKFGSGGGGEKPNKPAKPSEASEERAAARDAAKTLAALHTNGDHARSAIAKAVNVAKYSAKAVAAAGKHVRDKIKELNEKHPRLSSVIATAAVIAASEAVLHLVGAEEFSTGAKIGFATSVELCAEHLKEFVGKVAGLVSEKALSDEAEPTDKDIPEIIKAGKAFWDDLVSSFKPPKDAMADDTEKRIAAAVAKVVDARLENLFKGA